MMNSIWSYRPDSFCQLVTSEQDLVGSRTGCDLPVALGAACSDHSRSRLMRELNGTSADSARSTLHEDGLPLDRTCDVNRPMSRYAGNAETRTLFQRGAFR